MTGSSSLFHHVTPILRELHWLPVVFWVQFKVLLMTYEALYKSRLCGRSPYPTNICMTSSVIRGGHPHVSHTIRSMVGWGPSPTWPLLWLRNSLPVEVCQAPMLQIFCRGLTYVCCFLNGHFTMTVLCSFVLSYDFITDCVMDFCFMYWFWRKLSWASLVGN